MKKSNEGRILLVDDEPESLALLVEMISLLGYHATGNTSPDKTLSLLREQHFDVLITDLIMPEMDGLSMVRAATDIRPALICIVITGKGTVETAIDAMKAGTFDYVLKPVNLKILKGVLFKAMKLSSLRQSEEKYRSIVEDQTDLICRSKPDGTITFVNEVCCRYYGKPREELERETFPLFINGNREDLQPDISSPDRENPVAIFERQFRRPDGEVRWQKWINRALFDSNGRLVEYQSVGRDITDRKKAEEALQRSSKRLRALSARMAEIEEAQRKKIARELHDLVGQNLTVLGINLNLIREFLPSSLDSKIGARLDDSLGLVEETALCIRNVMADLRPEVLDDYGLLATLQWYAGRLSRRTGLPVKIRGEELNPRLPLPVETAFFRIAQEALTNVLKHAAATSATITLQGSEKSIRLTIADNGKGFDSSMLRQSDEEPAWGLTTMQERASAMGGSFSVESLEGEGTIVTIELRR